MTTLTFHAMQLDFHAAHACRHRESNTMRRWDDRVVVPMNNAEIAIGG
jgi:hypothetical protein